MEKQAEGRGCRVVLAPCPLQGHVNPMLQLGLALYNNGFSITIIHSTFNSPAPSQYPNFDLKPISNGSSELQACIGDPLGFAHVLNKSCEAPFRKYVSELVEGIGEEERVVCIISDMFTYYTKSVAEELGVPRFIFWTGSVNSFMVTSALPLLRQKGYLPLAGRGCRVVLAPCPLQGHVNPMLQLGLALYSNGFSITIIHSAFNSPTPSQFPNIDLKPISNGSSELQACAGDPLGFVHLLNKSCAAPFRKYVSDLVEGIGEEERIVCIISDMFTYYTKSVAEELGVPRFIFWTGSVNSFMVTSALPRLRQKGYLPLADPPSEDPVEELPPFRIKDLLDLKTADQEAWYELVDYTINEAIHSSGIMWNSFEFLEEAAIIKIQQEFGLQLFTVALLHQLHSPLPPQTNINGLPHNNTARCIGWLDQQEAKSVIYVSFGSLASITKSQLLEIAMGLVRSKMPFLWVLRPGLVIGEDHIKLPDEIEEVMRSKRGFVVDWAPQREVLAHPAVGGFWTHCGWNSVMESICEGVPMICTPCFGDQNANARFVSHVWKVGIQIEEELESGVVEMAIRKLIVEREGKKLKERIEALKEKAQLHGRGGDPSHNSFNKFVQFITSNK